MTTQLTAVNEPSLLWNKLRAWSGTIGTFKIDAFPCYPRTANLKMSCDCDLAVTSGIQGFRCLTVKHDIMLATEAAAQNPKTPQQWEEIAGRRLQGF